ncbi:MAG: hypothetical protein KC910_21860 [Candidatus Eremiobacteraeota bacterium]|nr:hypothetical protein [Candidatus Eremiobacteraeota bacterium]
MTIFTSVEAAIRHGFEWLEFLPQMGLHLVVRTDVDERGRRVARLALARDEKRV